MTHDPRLPFLDIDRRPDGTADWKVAFDRIYGAWNAARRHFLDRQCADRVLIEYLVSERLAARASGDFIRADAIRDALARAGVMLTDTPGRTRWHILFSTESGICESSRLPHRHGN
jgi:cysteinyl-tRNA synthetase